MRKIRTPGSVRGPLGNQRSYRDGPILHRHYCSFGRITWMEFLMTATMPDNSCPKCGGELRQTDKNTFTGEVWREYTCSSCGHIVDVNEGVALWQVLHDAAEKANREKDNQ